MCGEAGSSPGFTGSPLISMPRASDSGDSERTSHSSAPDTAFHLRYGVGITIRPISELFPRGLLTRCVRFAPASRPTNGGSSSGNPGDLVRPAALAEPDMERYPIRLPAGVIHGRVG